MAEINITLSKINYTFFEKITQLLSSYYNSDYYLCIAYTGIKNEEKIDDFIYQKILQIDNLTDYEYDTYISQKYSLIQATIKKHWPEVESAIDDGPIRFIAFKSRDEIDSWDSCTEKNDDLILDFYISNLSKEKKYIHFNNQYSIHGKETSSEFYTEGKVSCNYVALNNEVTFLTFFIYEGTKHMNKKKFEKSLKKEIIKLI